MNYKSYTPSIIIAKLARKFTYRFQGGYHFFHDYVRPLCSNEDILSWTNYRFRMYASPREHISFSVFFYKEYEAHFSHFVASHVARGDICWDIGANRGWYSLLMGQIVGPEGHVDGFEAFPSIYDKLVKNIELNNFQDWVHPV